MHGSSSAVSSAELEEKGEGSSHSLPPALPSSSSALCISPDVHRPLPPPSSLSTSSSPLHPPTPTIAARYSLIVDDAEENPPRSHIPARVDFLAVCDSIFWYNSVRRPPPRWLSLRHRSNPAIFLDTFSSTVFWTGEQQQALKDCFRGWNSDADHPFHGLYGDLVPSATRRKPSTQQNETQSHTVRYYIQHLHSRGEKTVGQIICNVKIHDFASTQAFRRGPSICDFYRYDLYQTNPEETELTMIAGMKNTWTPIHIDDGGDSTWSMLIEGFKVWVFGRPEYKEEFANHFNRSFTWTQLKPADREFLGSTACIMVYQRPGDIMYVPQGWPHMVKHLTDTVSINSALLNSWDASSALEAMDCEKWSREQWTMFRAAYARATVRGKRSWK